MPESIRKRHSRNGPLTRNVCDEIDRLIGLKKAEEAQVQELEGVRGRFFRISGHGTGPYIVIAPPGIGERAPFSFPRVDFSLCKYRRA
jgi:hypothetical protein